MELLLRMSLCLLTFFGRTFGDGNGISKISCKEDEDIVLPCSFRETLKDKRFDWKKDGKDVLLYDKGKVYSLHPDEQFRRRVSLFPEKPNTGDASISIHKAQVSDSGTYTCLYIDSAKNYTIELTVVSILKDRTGEKRNGSFGNPSVRRLNKNNDWALLKCEVHGAYPKPTLVWYDSAGNNISDEEPQWTKKEDRYDMILKTTVTKTDDYTCVASQEEIYHQSNKTTSVFIGELKNTAEEQQTGYGKIILIAAVAGVIGAIAGAVAAVCYFQPWHKRKRSDKTDESNAFKVSPNGAGNTNNQPDDGTEDQMLP